MTRLLSNDDVATAVSMPAIVDALERMYEELDSGTALARPRTDVHSPAANAGEYYRFKTMGGIVPSAGVYALRINSDILRWLDRDGAIVQEKLPRAAGDRYVGLVVLFDAGDGTPLTIMPDGYLQRLRVGATSAIGAKYLAREEAATLGVLGAGWQADGQVAAMAEVYDLEWIRVYSPTPASRRSFAEMAQQQYNVSVDAVSDPNEVFEADIVHCATNSRTPVYRVEQLRRGTHLGAITDQEIDPRTPTFCDVTIVHSSFGKGGEYWTANVDTGNIPYLDSDPDQALTEYAELAALVAGQTEGRTATGQITFFANNIGLGTQFAAIGAHIYEAALDDGLGEEFDTALLTQDLVP